MTLREEHKLQVFENKVLRKVFWHKAEVHGQFRILHNEQLYDLYSLSSVVGVVTLG